MMDRSAVPHMCQSGAREALGRLTWCARSPSADGRARSRPPARAPSTHVNRTQFGRNGNMKERENKRQRIAFFGHFDSTNFGNESTLQAVLYHVRRYQPDAEVTCITTGPEATVATHQIEALPISENLISSRRARNPLLRLMRSILIGIPSELYRWIDGLIRLCWIDVLVIAGTGLLTDAYGLGG